MATIEPTALNSNGTRYSTADHLGSPRVITNSTAGVISRHDYKPFGEELGSGIGGRTLAMGFGVADGNRKKFTSYERDSETGLDFAQARYHSSTFGRFTSPDPFGGSMRGTDPQSFNRYSYTGNSPVNRTDSSGLDWNADARYHGQWSIAHQTMADVDNARASRGLSGRDFEGSIDPQYPEPEPQEEVTVTVEAEVISPLIETSNTGMLVGTVMDQETVDVTQGLVQVIIWTSPTEGLKQINPVYRFGHVSFVIGDQSYSWQAHIDAKTGQEDWFIAPAKDYIRDKQKDGSRGTGYYLDFGSRDANEKFKNLLLNGTIHLRPLEEGGAIA